MLGSFPILRSEVVSFVPPPQPPIVTSEMRFWRFEESGQFPVAYYDSVQSAVLEPSTGVYRLESVPGKIGQGVKTYYGSENHLLFGTSLTGFDVFVTGFSLNCWVLVDQPAVDGNLLLSVSGDRYLLIYFNGSWYFTSGDGSVSVPFSAPTDWHMLTVSYSNSNRVLALRVNGGAPVTAVRSTAVAAGSAEWYFGRFPLTINYSFRGRFDLLSLYPSVLTDAEIAYLWNGGAGRDYPFT